MQATTLFRTLDHIRQKMQSEPLEKLLAALLFGSNQALVNSKEQFSELIFEARSRIDALKTDPETALVLDKLSIPAIFETARLSRMLSAMQTVSDTHNLRQQVAHYLDFYQVFSGLVGIKTFRDTLYALVIKPHEQTQSPEEKLLEFEIIDPGNVGIGFDRFRAVLTEIEALHETTSRCLDISAHIAIAYLDSGSNTLIAIKTDGKLIDSIRRLIIDIWDRFRFGKYAEMEKTLQSAEAGIEFITLINQKEKDGLLDPAVAAQFRYQAIHASLSLFETGATLKEIQVDTTIDNRALLVGSVNTKLLSNSPDTGASTSTGVNPLPPPAC